MTQEIKTRPDGSIDTAFYMAKGRVCRAEQARHMVTGLGQQAPKSRTTPWAFILLAIVVLPVAGVGLF